MKKTLVTLLAGMGVFGLYTAQATDLPDGRDIAAGQTVVVDCEALPDNGSFSVTLKLDAGILKQALAGTRTQVVDAHLNAGRKPKTDVGYAVMGGDVHYTYIQYYADQIGALAVEGDALQRFVEGEGNLDSITGAVITIVHATHQNTDGVAPGSHYHLDLYTTQGTRAFSGYTERLKISDRKFHSVTIPAGSPALKGKVFANQALTEKQAHEVNDKVYAD